MILTYYTVTSFSSGNLQLCEHVHNKVSLPRLWNNFIRLLLCGYFSSELNAALRILSFFEYTSCEKSERNREFYSRTLLVHSYVVFLRYFDVIVFGTAKISDPKYTSFE
jgi:hypothetical protein